MKLQIAPLRLCRAGAALSPMSPFAVNLCSASGRAGCPPAAPRAWKRCPKLLHMMSVFTTQYRTDQHTASQDRGTGAAKAARKAAPINRLKTVVWDISNCPRTWMFPKGSCRDVLSTWMCDGSIHCHGRTCHGARDKDSGPQLLASPAPLGVTVCGCALPPSEPVRIF